MPFTIPFDYQRYQRTVDAQLGCHDHLFAIRNKPTRNQRARLIHQCIRCGRVDSRTLKYKDADVPIGEIPLWDRDGEDRFCEARNTASKIMSQKRSAEWHQAYEAYLASPMWSSKRSMVLKRNAGLCEKNCGRLATQVHHVTYERVGEEAPGDLLAVCRICHEQIHGTCGRLD